MDIRVNSENVVYNEDYITSKYTYRTAKVSQTLREERRPEITVTPEEVELSIRTARKVPKLGVMLVGWGGNNGSTLTAAFLANRYKMIWETKKGFQEANWYGSITQSSTIRLGASESGEDFYAPLNSLLPMINPDDIAIDGWDISNSNLFESCKRAGVLEPTLLNQLTEVLKHLKPRPSIYDPDFIALNQADRVNNTIIGDKLRKVEQICNDISDFRSKSGADKIIVLWTANTERFGEVIPGVHDTAEHLTDAIAANHDEIAPSALFAYAAILSGCAYINGSPQNTFLPGIIDLAERRGVFIAGDDFKSGQTKLKSVLVDFLIGAGIKPVSIVSYNHLGNNDGKNLSSPLQFRSKEITKSNVVDDMVHSNSILYKPGEKPDHCVVIKYVPYVGDSKRAMDEYTSEIMLGGLNTLVVHNTCEDSLLAAPIILDLVILTEFCMRVQFKRPDEARYSSFYPILSVLSYLCKAPLVPKGTPVINSLCKQRMCIENVLRACLGLPPDNNMLLECKAVTLMKK